MSTIPQFSVYGELQGKDGLSKEFDYPIQFSRLSVDYVDPMGGKTVFSINRFMSEYDPNGCYDHLGLTACEKHPLNYNLKTVGPATPFGFGIEDFSIEMSFYHNAGIDMGNYNVLPLLYIENGICIDYKQEVLNVSAGRIRCYHSNPYFSFGEIPRSLVATANGVEMTFCFTRAKKLCFVHFRGTKILEFPTEEIFNVPTPTTPAYFFSTPTIDSGLTSSLNVGIKVTKGGFSSFGRNINKSYPVGNIFPCKLPPVRKFWPVAGGIRALQHHAFDQPIKPVITKSTFDVAASNPKIWYDATDRTKIIFNGLAPIPMTLKGKPGRDIILQKEYGYDGYVRYAQCSALRGTGVYSVYNEDYQEDDVAQFLGATFTAYAAVAQGHDNINGRFEVVFSGTMSNGYSSFVTLGYNGTAVCLNFLKHGSFNYDPDTLLHSETIPMSMQTKEVPVILYLRKTGNSYEFGANGAVKEIEYVLPAPVNTNQAFKVFHKEPGYGFIFYEGFVFERYLDDEEHEAALEYISSKHGISAGSAWANVEPDVEVLSGTVQKYHMPIASSLCQEREFYIPENELDLLINIDLSNENACIFNESGILTGYNDLADRNRRFDIVQSYYSFNEPAPILPATWGGRFKTYSSANFMHFMSTRRYNAPNGQTLFFVGRPPRLMLQQGFYHDEDFQFYYGFGALEDSQSGGMRLHYTSKTIGEKLQFLSGYMLYDYGKTLRGYESEFAGFDLYIKTGSYGNEYVWEAKPCIVCIKGNGVARLHLNGSNQLYLYGSGVPPWEPGDALRVCGAQCITQWNHRYEIGQFMLVNGVLDDTTMRKVVGQLAHKWNLVDKLDAACPYHDAPPLK